MVTPSKPPPPYEQHLPSPTPCFKMFLERPLNDPPPSHFKHLSLLPPSPSTTPLPSHKNFDHTLGVYKESSEDSSLALVGHVPIELSRLVAGFLGASKKPSVSVQVCGKGKRVSSFLDFIEQEQRRGNLAKFWSKKLKKLQSVIVTLTSI